MRFWTGKRRYPECTPFDPSATEHIHFAQHTACVLLQTLSTSHTPSTTSSVASSITASLALLLEDRARVQSLLQRLTVPVVVRSRKRQVVVEDEEQSVSVDAGVVAEVADELETITLSHDVASEDVVVEAEIEAVRLLQVLRVAVRDVVQLQVQLTGM